MATLHLRCPGTVRGRPHPAHLAEWARRCRAAGSRGPGSRSRPCGSLHGVRNGPMRARGCRSGTARPVSARCGGAWPGGGGGCSSPWAWRGSSAAPRTCGVDPRGVLTGPQYSGRGAARGPDDRGASPCPDRPGCRERWPRPWRRVTRRCSRTTGGIGFWRACAYECGAPVDATGSSV